MKEKRYSVQLLGNKIVLHSTVVVCRRMRAAPQTGVSDDVGTWSQRRNTGCKVAGPPVHHTQVFGPRQPTLVGVDSVLGAAAARHGGDCCRRRRRSSGRSSMAAQAGKLLFTTLTLSVEELLLN